MPLFDRAHKKALFRGIYLPCDPIEILFPEKIGSVAGWDSLVLMGIPSEYVNALKSTEIGFQSDS